MVEETKEELVKEEKKKEDGVKKENIDLYAPIYSINYRTPSGDAVGLLKVSSETKKYILEGSNFNWDAFEKIFNSTSTPEVIQDLIENPTVLRVPVGEQMENQKSYYLIKDF